MDPDELMQHILDHVKVITDEFSTPSSRATHGEWLAERVEQLDTLIVTGVGLPTRWRSPEPTGEHASVTTPCPRANARHGVSSIDELLRGDPWARRS